jgi:hypothetical protein
MSGDLSLDAVWDRAQRLQMTRSPHRVEDRLAGGTFHRSGHLLTRLRAKTRQLALHSLRSRLWPTGC